MYLLSDANLTALLNTYGIEISPLDNVQSKSLKLAAFIGLQTGADPKIAKEVASVSKTLRENDERLEDHCKMLAALVRHIKKNVE